MTTKRKTTKKAPALAKVWPKTQVLAAFDKGGIESAKKLAERLDVTHKLNRWFTKDGQRRDRPVKKPKSKAKPVAQEAQAVAA
jgi:hypothetical protein